MDYRYFGFVFIFFSKSFSASFIISYQVPYSITINIERDMKEKLKQGKKYLGVFKSGKRWKAQIQYNFTCYYLGTFQSEEGAAMV